MAARVATSVLVVGAGPAGLLAALRLAAAGVKVEIIDEQWRPAGHSYALGLHPSSLALLDGLGIARDIVDAGARVAGVSIWEGRHERVRAPLGDGAFPFVLSLPQNTLERVLEAKLALRGVHVRWSHRLAAIETSEYGVTARVERLVKESSGYAVARSTWVVDKAMEFRSEFVIGADGHHSMVRRCLDIPFEESSPSQVFAVCECDVGRPIGSDLRLVVAGPTISAMWPLPDGRVRWSLEIEAPEVSADDRNKSRLITQFGERYSQNLDEAELRAVLSERAPWFEPLLTELGWTIEMRFERRLAARLGHDRTWLVGDAAHLTGPLGMQSMNSGLAEAAELADTISGILLRHESASRLHELEQKTLAAWAFLHGKTGGLKPSAETPAVLASRADHLLPCLPGTGREIDALARSLSMTVERG